MALAELRERIPNATAGELELVAQYGASPRMRAASAPFRLRRDRPAAPADGGLEVERFQGEDTAIPPEGGARNRPVRHDRRTGDPPSGPGGMDPARNTLPKG